MKLKNLIKKTLIANHGYKKKCVLLINKNSSNIFFDIDLAKKIKVFENYDDAISYINNDVRIFLADYEFNDFDFLILKLEQLQ